MKAFIGGPMSGYADYNFPAFFAAEAALISMGYEVANPARLFVDLGHTPSREECTRITMELLLNSKSDDIFLLPDWRNSKGASLEAVVASQLGMRVFETGSRVSQAKAIKNKINLILENPKQFKIITLCGSTRFKKEFEEINAKLTMEGNMVVSVGVFGHADGIEMTDEQKEQLDKIHFQKINMADEIYVVNVGGYIGSSTKREITHAKLQGIPVRYLEQ